MHEIRARCGVHLRENHQSGRWKVSIGPMCGATQYQQLAIVLVKHGSSIGIFGARSASGIGSICFRDLACGACSHEVTVTNDRKATPNI